MKRLVLLLSAIVFALSPAVAAAGSTPADQHTSTAQAVPETYVPAKSDADGQPIKDSWITSKTKMSLATDKRVKARHITVETTAGIVTLRGKVGSAAERSAAHDITMRIHGVKGVSNALQVVPDWQRKAVNSRDDQLENAVRTRLANDPSLKTADIHVRADAAVITLMGTVHNVHGVTHAGDLARGIHGVKAVRNELRQQQS